MDSSQRIDDDRPEVMEVCGHYHLSIDHRSSEGTPSRYKLVEVGMIPMHWDCVRLGDVSLHVGSGITPTGGARVYTMTGRPFLRSQNVGWGALDLNDIAYITNEVHATFPTSEVQEGDVLLNITGASIGRSAVADSRVAGGNVNQHVCEIRPDRTKIDPYFLSCYLLSEAGQKQIASFQAGGNRQGLNYNQIRSFWVPCPLLPEQRTIAEALSDVDGLLGALDALIAKKRAIKQATMQQLLTGKTRLPGEWQVNAGYKQTEVGVIPKDWELKTLGAVLNRGELGGNYPNQETEAEYPLMKMGNIARGYFDMSKVEFITPGVAPEPTHRLVGGDVLFNTRNTLDLVGKVAIWRDELPVAYYNSNLMRLEFDPKDVCSNEYANYALNTTGAVARLRGLATGTTSVAAIYTRDLMRFQFIVPPKPEQRAIATVLSDMDAEIAALEQRRDKTRAIKQGMMQQLLTGRIRLVEPVQAETGA